MFENHIRELRGEELYKIKKITVFIDATFAVAKRKPEFFSGFFFATAEVASITARIAFYIILFHLQLTEDGPPGSNGAFARTLVEWALRPGFAIVTIPAQPTVDEHALVRELTDGTVT